MNVPRYICREGFYCRYGKHGQRNLESLDSTRPEKRERKRRERDKMDEGEPRKSVAKKWQCLYESQSREVKGSKLIDWRNLG